MIQLFGGLDSFNMLVPHSLCDAAAGGYAEYLQARGGLFTGREDSGVALRQDTLQQIAAGASSKPQPCDVMGLHPKLVKTKAMYESGDAAIYANVGALIEHLTPDEFFGGDGRKEVPDALFSHNVQDRFMQTLSNNQFEPGILGKVMRALDTPACDAYGSTSAGSARTSYKTGLYAMHSGSARALEGGPVLPLSIDSRRADIRRLSEYEQLWPHIENLTAAPSRSVFAETHSRVLGRAIQDAETLGDAIDAAATTAPFNDCCDGGSCGLHVCDGAAHHRSGHQDAQRDGRAARGLLDGDEGPRRARVDGLSGRRHNVDDRQRGRRLPQGDGGAGAVGQGYSHHPLRVRQDDNLQRPRDDARVGREPIDVWRCGQR